MWMMIPGAGSSAPTAGRDSSVSPLGRNTLRITGGDPTGSPPAFVPVGQGKSFGLTLALWGTNQIPWRWRRLRARRGNREFPPDSGVKLSGAPGLKRTFPGCDILSFPAPLKKDTKYKAQGHRPCPGGEKNVGRAGRTA